jgi:hypothetical protein
MLKFLIVTHRSPDLDAVGAVWMLKRFDHQHYADAHVAFVDSGSLINPNEAERLGFQMHQVTHVDTGKGEFDHHQPERGHLKVCATSLAYDYACRLHPEFKKDEALSQMVEFITQIDHFEEIFWPEADSPRYAFMLHEFLDGFESFDNHTDDSKLHFGMQCLDCVYVSLKEWFQAKNTLNTGTEFMVDGMKALAIETKNDKVIKFAQKAGFSLVIRKDPDTGEMRIKARPDAAIDLTALYEKISKIDPIGSWYNHPSGKMLLNGSSRQRSQRPTPLNLQQVMEMVKEIYG